MAGFLLPQFKASKLAQSIAISSVGTGIQLYSTVSSTEAIFRTLLAGSNVSINVLPAGGIQISATVPTTTASNLGSTGEGIFASKVGDDLRFKRLIAGTNITLTATATGITITGPTIPAIPNVVGNSLGSGTAVYVNKTSDTLNFRSLAAGSNITLTVVDNEIVISSTGSGGSTGEVNTATSLGSGAAVYKEKVGVDFRFRSLLASAGLSWSTEANTLTLTLDVTTSPTDTTSGRVWRTDDLVKQTSPSDSTAGRVAIVGYAGLGTGSPSITYSADYTLDAERINTRGRVFAASVVDANAPPGAQRGVADTKVYNSTSAIQTYAQAIGGYRIWGRQLSTTWTPWYEHWHSGNQLNIGTTPALARSALELGSSALGDLLSNPFETTPGAILRIGDHGIGSSNTANITDLNQLFPAGFRNVAGSAAGRPSDGGTANGSILFLPGGTATRQAALFITDSIAVPRIYLRTFIAGTANPWLQFWTTANFDPTTKVDSATLYDLTHQKHALSTNITLRIPAFADNGSSYIGYYQANGTTRRGLIGYVGSRLAINNELDSVFLRHAGSTKLETSASGVTITGVMSATSDKKYKTQVKKLSGSLARIMQLKPKSYFFSLINSFQFGFIAQEVKKIYPNSVSRIKEEGRKSSLVMTKDEIITDLVVVVQAQEKRIQRLEAIINDLAK